MRTHNSVGQTKGGSMIRKIAFLAVSLVCFLALTGCPIPRSGPSFPTGVVASSKDDLSRVTKGILDLRIQYKVTDGDLDMLSKAESLTGLIIEDGTALTSLGAAKLAKLTSLVSLVIRQSTMNEAGFKELAALPKLAKLQLVSPKNLTISGVEVFGSYPSLTQLHLVKSDCDDSWCAVIARLTRLEYLILSGCKGVTDAGMKSLALLESLQYLDLSDTKVGDQGLSELTGLKQMRIIKLYGCAGVSEKGRQKFRSARPLVKLYW